VCSIQHTLDSSVERKEHISSPGLAESIKFLTTSWKTELRIPKNVEVFPSNAIPRLHWTPVILAFDECWGLFGKGGATKAPISSQFLNVKEK